MARRKHIGETCRHFKTRIEEHSKNDDKSHIFKHLHSAATCFDSYDSLCFKIINKANSKFDLKIKEALHTNWRKSFQKFKITTKSFSSHTFTIASVPLAPFCLCLFFFCCFFLQLSFMFVVFFCCFFFATLFHLLFSLSLR